MVSETKKVQILDSKTNIIDGKFIIYEESPNDEDLVLLELHFNNKKHTKTDENFFAAMIAIRKELEVENLLLNCYGASKQVYPSGMALNMGYGRKAYKLQLGQQAKTADLVDIFETADDVEPVTIEEQQSFYQKWLKSIVKK